MEKLDFKYSGVMPGFINLFTFYILLKSESKTFLTKNQAGVIVNSSYVEEKANLYLPGIDISSLIFFLDQIDLNYNRKDNINLGFINLLEYHISAFGYPPKTNWNVNLHPLLRDRIIQELNIISGSPRWIPFFRDHALNQLLSK